MAEATVIDISPVRRTTALTPRTTGDGESGSGFNALKWAMELLFVNKQTATSLREISSTLLGIRGDNARYEQARNETAQQAREQLERQQEAGQDVVQRQDITPRRFRDDENTKKRDPNSFTSQLGSILSEWKNASYIGRGIWAAIRNVGKIFNATRIAVTAIRAFLGVGGAATLVTALSVAIAGISWGVILYGILDRWGKAHKIGENYKREGRRGIAEDEAKVLGIETSDKNGPKETKALAREVANKLQETGQITPEDRKAAGVAAYKEGEGFTDDDAMKLMEYRQKQRVEKKYGPGLKGSIAAALAGPPRESQSKPPSTQPSTPTPRASVSTEVSWNEDTSTVTGEGLPSEMEVLPSSTLPVRTAVAPSVTPNLPTTPRRAPSAFPAETTDTTAPVRQSSDMLAAIRSHEQGKAGYDSTLGNGAYRPGGAKDETQKPITNMTLSEIFELQSAILRNPQNKWKSTAVGAYQFTRSTLFGERGTPDKPTADSLVGKMGLTKNTKFTPELQDQLATALVERRSRQAQRMASSGNTTFESAFQTALSQEWASIQDVTGQGYYANQRNARTDIRPFVAPTRQAAPLQAGTAQLAQAQMQAPIVMAVNMGGGGSQIIIPPQPPIPVPVRPRSQDDVLRMFQTMNQV